MILPNPSRLRHATTPSTPAALPLTVGRLFAGVGAAPLATGAADEPARLTRNWFLGTLPDAERAELLPHLETVMVEAREVLIEAGRPVEYVYFPESAIISMVGPLLRDASIAVASVGREGIVGLSTVLGTSVSAMRAMGQIPGTARRIRADVLRELAAPQGAVRESLLRHTEAFLVQVAQTAVCNAAHLVEERCARWLLMTHDRVAGDEFPLTQELLAFMLGVRRAGVSEAAALLRRSGLIDYSRGRITVRDRAGLESSSCECYRIVRAHVDRLLSEDDAGRSLAAFGPMS